MLVLCSGILASKRASAISGCFTAVLLPAVAKLLPKLFAIRHLYPAWASDQLLVRRAYNLQLHMAHVLNPNHEIAEHTKLLAEGGEQRLAVETESNVQIPL
jgi:hypothetical protein